VGLPNGVTLNRSTGALVGRPVAAAAVNGAPTSYSVTIQAATAAGLVARKTFTFTVYPKPVYTVTAPAGTVGVAYTGQLTVTNSPSTPVAYSVASGALPTSLSLNASTGAITGTPSAAGTFTGTFRVTGDKGGTTDTAFSITIT
jgi:hypothetical protein